MRALDEITLEALEASYPPAFYRRTQTHAAAQAALQEVVAADYEAEIERRLAILRTAYPRHTFRWISGNGTAYVACECKRGRSLDHLYGRGFMGDFALRCEIQMKEHASYHRVTGARKRALLILWQQVEAILALHLDADETFNIAI